ncbi:MAG TPA: L-threonylcarbamoyladenylate synthase [Candidatus Wallbacteria bacterium]|nr:L-threonylcarbamoyladenylate synthase [Candidatus Wallbacteria bacterium]
MGVVTNYPVWNVLDVPLPEIKKDAVIIFPTETVYGIGAFLSNAAGVERIFEVKKRENKPLSLHVPVAAGLEKYVEKISVPAERALSLYAPGPLMMIFKLKAGLVFPARATANGNVGVRVFSNFITASIVNAAGEPLLATSANISGGASPKNFFDVPEELVDECDIAIDNGPTMYQKDSTIIDFSGDVPVMLREGAIGFEELSDVLATNIRRAI